MGERKTFGVLGLILFVCLPVLARSREDREGAKQLAQKLLKLSQSLDMKESTYEDSKGGGKDFNDNDGNSFTSYTTYHSYVWDYCEEWVGPQNCRRWLDPYVSSHGQDGDRSPLEGAIWDEYSARRPRGPVQGNAGQYAIWQVRSRDGNITEPRTNRLNREQLAEFKLLPDVAAKAAFIGDRTAVSQIRRTFDNGENDESLMPNMESLRLMASRWTKMFRNRLVANLSEMRAADEPVEFGLGEDKPDCDRYLLALREEMDQFNREVRLNPQKQQAFITRQTQLERRYDLCQKLRQTDAYAINPKVQGDTIVETSPENERIDKWRTRVNIAAIDFVGIDPNSLPKPNDQVVSEEEASQEVNEFASGGDVVGARRKTNAQQLQEYNQALEEAAAGFKEVAARSAQIRDNSAQTLKYRVKPGTVNMVRLNSLTGEMRQELAGTDFKGNYSAEHDLERSGANLTVTRR